MDEVRRLSWGEPARARAPKVPKVGGSVDVSQQTRTGAKLLGTGALAAAISLFAAILWAPAASARPAFVAVSSENACLANQNINPFLRKHGANVLRLILSPQDAEAGAGLACVQDGHSAGFKVYVSLQFNNAWSPRQIAAYFSRVLPSYAPYLWAVGVGNEQDLTMASNYGQGRSRLGGHGRTTGQAYRATWNAVEPVLAKIAPRAIRVYGEFSPWGFSANQQGFASGRPAGVQAIAAHCYHTRFGGLMQVPQDAAWAASKRLPLWCSEMAPALVRPAVTRWAVHDTWGSWSAAIARIESRSSNLRMTGYYYSPSF